MMNNNQNQNRENLIDQARELLSPYLDDEVTPTERALVETMLTQSSDLQLELDGLRQTVNLLGQMPRIPAPRPFTLTEADAGQEPAKSTLWWKSWFSPRLKPLFGGITAIAAIFIAVIFITNLNMTALEQNEATILSAPEQPQAEIASAPTQSGENGENSNASQARTVESTSIAASTAPMDNMADGGMGSDEADVAMEEAPQQKSTEPFIESSPPPPSVDTTMSDATLSEAEVVEGESNESIEGESAGDVIETQAVEAYATESDEPILEPNTSTATLSETVEVTASTMMTLNNDEMNTSIESDGNTQPTMMPQSTAPPMATQIADVVETEAQGGSMQPTATPQMTATPIAQVVQPGLQNDQSNQVESTTVAPQPGTTEPPTDLTRSEFQFWLVAPAIAFILLSLIILYVVFWWFPRRTNN